MPGHWEVAKVLDPPCCGDNIQAESSCTYYQTAQVKLRVSNKPSCTLAQPAAYLVIPYCYRQPGGGCKLAIIDRAGKLSSCPHKAPLKTDQWIIRHLLFGRCLMWYILLWTGILVAAEKSQGPG
jgi:hypothetical protein